MIKNRSDVRRFWRSGDSTSKRVLDVVESFCLRLWKITVQRVAVVKVRMNDRSGDGTGSQDKDEYSEVHEYDNSKI